MYWIAYESRAGHPNRDAYLVAIADDFEEAVMKLKFAADQAAYEQPQLRERILEIVVGDPVEIPAEDPRANGLDDGKWWRLEMAVTE